MRKALILLIAAFVLTACGEEGVWEEVDRAGAEEEEEFILEYISAWEESLEVQSFSVLEPYYVLNTHGYHTERRQHQQLVSSRSVEALEELHSIYPEENEFGEERVRLEGVFSTTAGGESVEEEQTRYYYLMRKNDEWKIDAIGRENQSE
ncbi:hypothetical protein [Alkalicoccus daliensis]|uniref:DUF4878 domain-containing protein n=1 Tax=Alkalicoccus daliensis TaxID=745820 RepID=A0A1H0ARQ2_9BACI|nr:hypothetical protein [Alkalicoccus daliensis]SDN36147.1 hypothetical protein SAMN04488053_101590 [Alkalicoccus daliensis]